MAAVRINGEPRTIDENVTLADLLRALGIEAPGIAVAVNDDVVPRARFHDRRVLEGDTIEIIQAVAGG